MINELTGWPTNVMLAAETAELKYEWQMLDEITFSATTINDFTRYQKLLNFRVPAKIMIQRWGEPGTDGGIHLDLGLDAAFTVIDNIRVSPPPSDVTVRKVECVFDPGYPSVNTNLMIRCFVDNVDMNVPTDYSKRTVRVVYRWRYLDQSIGAWRTNTMAYVAGSGSGQGNGEQFATTNAIVYTQVGDLEYYFTCDFDGYRYKSPDYTGLNFSYASESDGISPRTLRGGASEPDGREFYARLRPFRSPYGAVYVVADELTNAVAMELVGDNEWRGLVPSVGAADTNLTWYFKGVKAYEGPGSDTFSTGTVCWTELAQSGVGRVPYGGVCVETNDSGRIRVKVDAGGYVMMTLNTETKDYMARRAEYQNFNAWPARADKFSESSGQSAKQSFLNTFEAWPVNTETTYSEFFDLYLPSTNVYSREPFGTMRNWIAGSAAFVVERVEADIYNKPVPGAFRNQALRLKGGSSSLGLGYVYNTVASRTDGIKQLSFKYRLGQPASNFDVAYDRTRFTTNNYLVRANARSYAAISPEQPSFSLIGYYRDPDNFYEYRLTQVPHTTTLDQRISHQIYKWVDGVPSLKASANIDGYNLTSSGITIEMRLYNASASSTMIRCRFGSSDNVVTFTDNSAPIQSGTYGVLSADCKAGFSDIFIRGTTVNAAENTATTLTKVLDSTLGSAAFNDYELTWYTPVGRFVLDSGSSPKGIYAVIPDQKLGVYLQTSSKGSTSEPAAPGTTAWKKFQELSVSGFGYSTNTVTIKDWQTQYVMLQVLGMTNTLSATDVAVDELAVTSWRGQQSGSGAVDDWLATEAWVVSNSVAEGNVVQLDHSRADTNAAQAVRSILLETGMGLMEFDYRVLRAPAKLTVQYAPERDSEAWEDVQSFVFSNVTSWAHASAYLGTNAPGYLRVLNDRRGGYSNAWVEINNGLVWDEPVVEQTAWRAYNVKITDTDLQRVMLDKSKACFLNNSTTLDTDPIQNQNQPNLQSPVLPNGLGELTLMARAYTNAQASTIQVYASTNGWDAPTNLWFKINEFSNITNLFFKTYSFKPIDGRTYDAIKLVTTTTNGSARACVEEVVVSEPVFPGFDIINVKVFGRAGSSITDLDRSQPIDTDDVGVQAEIANKQLSPSNITMYVDYYVGTNVWGVGNWPSNAVVSLPMVQIGATTYQTYSTNDIPPQDSDQVVQYRVRAEYMGGVPLVKVQETFDNPSWYYPVDLNKKYAAQGWSPYYIVYGVPVGTVWINEVNATDYVVSNGVPQTGFWDNPYIEIAVPAGVNLAGWSVDLVTDTGYVTRSIPILDDYPVQEAVTNGYGFFVIGERYPQAGLPPLPGLDYTYAGLAYYIPSVFAGGLRLRRPMGMYEQAIAYDWDPVNYGGPAFSGETWAANDPEGQFVYVGREENNGSLSVTNGTGKVRADWVFPLSWTPGQPNIGQSIELPVLGSSNVWVISTLSSLNGTQNGQRKLYEAFRMRSGSSSNILYVADDWYRLYSVKVNQVEQLGTPDGVQSFPVPLVMVRSNVNVDVEIALRRDIADLSLSSEMLNWLLSFGDGKLVPSYYYGTGRELTLTELYWLNANPTVTNRLDGGIANFNYDLSTNFFVTVSLALNGTNCTTLQSDARLKLEMTQSLMAPNWWIVGQYILGSDSFDTNHLCRIRLANPFPEKLPAWDPKSAFFHWVIEREDPRITPEPLVNSLP